MKREKKRAFDVISLTAMCRKGRNTFILLKWLFLVFGAFSSFILTFPSSVDASELKFQPGHTWGMLVGYGFQHRGWTDNGSEEVDLSFFYPTMIIVSYSLGPLLINLDLQALLAARTDRGEGFLAGGGPVARIMYSTESRVSPYLHLGVGVLYTNIDLEGMEQEKIFLKKPEPVYSSRYTII